MEQVTAAKSAGPFNRLARPVYGFALRKIMSMASRELTAGRLDVTLPNGQNFTADSGAPGPHAKVHFRDMRAIWMITTAGDLGFAEAYMAGMFDTPELKDVLDLTVANEAFFQGLMSNRGLAGWLANRLHASRDNSRQGSKENIYAHYDLGNTFYGSWLDESMTYSSAVYSPDATSSNQSLVEAQHAKYARIAQIGGFTPNSHVLEIGCGWGGFAEYAAKHVGCKVTGVTISQAQYEFAAQRMQREGLNEKVELRIQDYRDIEPEGFNGVASIEMFEAVGEKHWPGFFGQVNRVLKPGGRASMQIITIADDLFEHYRNGVDFIQKYIFPGGMLPSVAKLTELSDEAGLRLEQNDGFALDYSRTLLEWNERFQKVWPEIRGGKFDEPFRRMWEYYLKYCATGFESGRIDVRQLAWAK